MIAAPEGLYSVSRYQVGWNPWAWLELTLFKVGCSHKLVCEVSFEGLGSAEPYLRPRLSGTPTFPDWVNAQMIEFHQRNFVDVLDRSAPNLASFEPIPLHELAEMSPDGIQWLRKQLREFSAILQESRTAMTRLVTAQTVAHTILVRRESDRGEDEGDDNAGDVDEGDNGEDEGWESYDDDSARDE